jgi:hypothetical protein
MERIKQMFQQETREGKRKLLVTGGTKENWHQIKLCGLWSLISKRREKKFYLDNVHDRQDK